MKTQLYRTVLCFFILHSSFCLRSWGQGTAFTYQGQLQNNGALASGTYNLQFTLYANSTGGTAVAGPVTNNAVSVTNGLFTVLINFGPGVFTGATNWLQIGVATNGVSSFTTLSPRQQLTPVPYAVFAENSGVVNDASVSALQLNTPGAPASGQVLAYNGTSLVWSNQAAGGGNSWSLTGNAGTSPGSGNFLGTTDNNPLDLHVNSQRALRLEPYANAEGGPNVIGGSSVNFVAAGTVGAAIGGGGAVNYYSYSNSTNSVAADYGTVGGGLGNTVTESGLFSTVGGGYNNTASSGWAAIGGGNGNLAGNFYAGVGGGFANQAVGPGSFVGGGGFTGSLYGGNVASGGAATVGGGYTNVASGTYATVGGGSNNVISPAGIGAVIPGGAGNTAKGVCSMSAGQNAAANDNNSFIWGDGSRTAQSQGPNSFAVLATGGVFFYTTPSDLNVDLDNSGDLDFGTTTRQMLNLWGTSYGIGVQNNDEYFRSGDEFFWYVGGSHNNGNGNAGGGTQAMELDNNGNLFVTGAITANNMMSTNVNGLVSYGLAFNEAIVGYALGIGNAVDGYAGNGDGVYGQSAGVGAGIEGYNSGSGPAGQFDGNVNITGTLSFGNALGNEIAQMLNLYGTSYGIGVQTDDMYFRTADEFWWYIGGTNNGNYGNGGGGTMLMRLGSSGNLIIAGTLSQNSDRNVKSGFQPVDARRVLEKIATMPLSRWHYTNDVTAAHIGPMAQDFYAAFGLGEDERHITTIDEGGVALAAIQGLNQKLEAEEKQKDTEITELENEVSELKQMVKQLAQGQQK